MTEPIRADPCQAENRFVRAHLHYIEGISPTDSADSVLFEGIAVTFVKYLSLQLSVNVRNGHPYNAVRALSHDYNTFGFTVDAEKLYIADLEMEPIITHIFENYSHGATMQKMANHLNNQSAIIAQAYKFSPKTLNKLSNTAPTLANSRSVRTSSDGRPASSRSSSSTRCSANSSSTFVMGRRPRPISQHRVRTPRTTGSQVTHMTSGVAGRWREFRACPRPTERAGTTTA